MNKHILLHPKVRIKGPMYIKRKQEDALDTCILSECNLVSAMVHRNQNFCLATSVVNDKTIDCLCVHSVFALALPFSEPDPLCASIWFRDYIYSYRCAVHSHVPLLFLSSGYDCLLYVKMEGEVLGFLQCDLSVSHLS